MLYSSITSYYFQQILVSQSAIICHEILSTALFSTSQTSKMHYSTTTDRKLKSIATEAGPLDMAAPPRPGVRGAVPTALRLPIASVAYHLTQWFSNFFWSRAICVSRTVITYHVVPGKVNVPNIIRSKVWKTRIDKNVTRTKRPWEILMDIFRKQQGKQAAQKFRSLLTEPDK